MKDFKCPNCEVELDAYKDKLMCLVHDTIYCVWCAEDKEGNCKDKECRPVVYAPF